MTVPDEGIAQKIATELIEERMAACVTISAPCQSHYRWQGKITKDKEHMLFIKTRANLYSRLQARMLKMHPYEVPEIVAFPMVKGYKKYLNWIAEETAE